MPTAMQRLALLLGACALFGISAAHGADSDGEILAIAQAANTAEIDAGRLAKAQARNPQVRQFAQQVVQDHEAMNSDLAKLAYLELLESGESRRIRQEAMAELDKLKSVQEGAFDMAYIEQQIRMHETVSSLMQDELLPNTRDARLKAALDKAAPKIRSHLQMARQIRSSMD